MRLDGIHHVTCITGDAPANVDFYTGVLGLRLVKKTVNQDDPTVYHLFYADEKGSPGSDITFFEYPGAAPGRAGAGMVHTVVWRVGSEEALDFWAGAARRRARRQRRSRSPIPKGCSISSSIASVPDEPLIAEHPEIPRELALQGFEGVRAYGRDSRQRAAPFFEELGFEPDGEPLGDARRLARRLDRVRGGARRVRHPRRRHGASRRVGVDDRGRGALARAGRRGRRPADRRDRPLLVPLDLLPRAERRALRDRDARPRVRDRRGSGAPRRDAHPAARVRASARAGRADPHAAAESARELDAARDAARARAPRGWGARGRARSPARPRRRRARPLPAARRARSRAAAARLHAARAARAAARRRALVRRAARRLSRSGDVRRGLRRARPSGSTRCRSRRATSCSAASRRAPS